MPSNQPASISPQPDVHPIKKAWRKAGNLFFIEFLILLLLEMPLDFLRADFYEYLVDQNQKSPSQRDHLIWRMTVGLFALIFAILYVLALTLRHLVMSVISPIDFMKVAYHLGEQCCTRYAFIGKTIGVIFAIASMFFSATLTATVISLVLPLIMSNAGSGGWAADTLNSVLAHLGLGNISSLINKITGVSERFADIATAWFSLSVLFPLAQVFVKNPVLVLTTVAFFFQSLFWYVFGKGVTQARDAVLSNEPEDDSRLLNTSSDSQMNIGLSPPSTPPTRKIPDSVLRIPTSVYTPNSDQRQQCLQTPPTQRDVETTEVSDHTQSKNWSCSVM